MPKSSRNIICTEEPNLGCMLCKCLSEDSKILLEEHKNTLKYLRGQYIYMEGTRPSGVYCVYEGKIKILKVGMDKEQIIHLAKKGDILGVTSVLSNDHYTSSALALEDSYVCFIPKDYFLQMLELNPALNIEIRKYICRLIDQMEDKVVNLSQRSVRERLAATILILNDAFGMVENNEILIDIPLTREDMANLVGTATETVIRLLSEFRKDGLVDFNGKRLTITNLSSLKKVAFF